MGDTFAHRGRGRPGRWECLECLGPRELERAAEELMGLDAWAEQGQEYSVLTRRQVVTVRRLEKPGVRGEILALGRALFMPGEAA